MPGPFDGLRVIDLTTIFAGPLTSQLLGDMGAEVIKVEPPDGDMNRNTGPSASLGMSSNFLHTNRNKRGLALDLKTPEGAEAMRRLIAGADVFVHNMRAEPLARLGLDYAAARALRPDIVYCNISGFGRAGRYAGMPAYDDIIQGACGLVALEAFGGGEARFVPSLIADKVTPLQAAYAIAAALYHRQATGEGQEIEVPMFETMVAFTMVEHLWGESFLPARGGLGSLRHATPNRWPHRTKDGHICALPTTDRHWDALLTIAGREDLWDEPVMADRRTRAEHVGAVMRLLGEVLATRTTAEWLPLLAAAGIPAMPVARLEDVVADPHLAEAGFWHKVDHPTEGRLRLMNPPWSMSATPPAIRRPAPRLGEHTREVLAELGYDAAQIERMIAAGGAVAEPPATDGD